MKYHSPLPWKRDDKANVSSVSLRGANGFAVAACRLKAPNGETTSESRREGRDNAAFIHHATALHRPIVDALENLIAKPCDMEVIRCARELVEIAKAPLR